MKTYFYPMLSRETPWGYLKWSFTISVEKVWKLNVDYFAILDGLYSLKYEKFWIIVPTIRGPVYSICYSIFQQMDYWCLCSALRLEYIAFDSIFLLMKCCSSFCCGNTVKFFLENPHMRLFASVRCHPFYIILRLPILLSFHLKSITSIPAISPYKCVWWSLFFIFSP